MVFVLYSKIVTPLSGLYPREVLGPQRTRTPLLPTARWITRLNASVDAPRPSGTPFQELRGIWQ